MIKVLKAEGSNLLIQVVDTGVGIEEEMIPSLFQVFTKIMQDRDMNKTGIGLGLSISKNLANALGGDITVKSIKGIGSEFSLTIKNMAADNLSSVNGIVVTSNNLQPELTQQQYAE